jgi:hypothetical protein
MSANNNHTKTEDDKMETEEERTGTVKQECVNLVDTVEERMMELEEKERHWAALEASMEEHASNAAQKITLDIGTCSFPFLFY